MTGTDIAPVRAFLACDTPDAWVEAALDSLDTLLIDHANCEKKAAGTALNMLFRYVDRPRLLTVLSKIAREELRHFEQVLKMMHSRGVTYRQLSSSRYAAGLFAEVRRGEPRAGHRYVDRRRHHRSPLLRALPSALSPGGRRPGTFLRGPAGFGGAPLSDISRPGPSLRRIADRGPRAGTAGGGAGVDPEARQGTAVSRRPAAIAGNTGVRASRENE